MYDKFFSIHIDILTYEQHLVRISVSNLYREFKTTQTSIQFPYTSINKNIHWILLCLDLESILVTYMTNQHYHMIKSLQLCGNMMVKNCFSSQFLYDPGVINHKVKQNGLKCAGIRSLPRELSYPVDKDESWYDKYDFIMIPNASSYTEKNSNEKLDETDNAHLQTSKELNINDEPFDRSLTNSALNIQRSNSPKDNQVLYY